MNNNLVLLIILMIACVVGLVQFRRKRLALSNAKYMETLTIGDLEQKLYDMQNIEGNSYRHYSEFKGNILSDSTISAILSQINCVYYKTTITEHYEEYESYKDSTGNIRFRWVPKSRVEAVIKDSVIMYIADDTSANRVIIDNENDFDIEYKEKAQFGRHDSIVDYFNLSPTNSASHKTTHYTVEEEILKHGDEVYILGDGYYTESHELHLGKTSRSGSIGVVTTKSEEELIRSYANASIGYLVLAVASCIGVIIMTIKLLR